MKYWNFENEIYVRLVQVCLYMCVSSGSPAVHQALLLVCVHWFWLASCVTVSVSPGGQWWELKVRPLHSTSDPKGCDRVRVWVWRVQLLSQTISKTPVECNNYVVKKKKTQLIFKCPKSIISRASDPIWAASYKAMLWRARLCVRKPKWIK